MTKFITMTKPFLLILFLSTAPTVSSSGGPYIIVLGTAQDGGIPHIGCQKDCCLRVVQGELPKRLVVSLAVVDEASQKWWLIEATPDITSQLEKFSELTGGALPYLPDAIFVTHAHIGHYTGLMYFGREALGAKQQQVYALPGMKTYLQTNGPWSQLVELGNIRLTGMSPDSSVRLSKEVTITPFAVPHRDEFSETAGFHIRMGPRTALFIPDIDRWQRFNRPIERLVNDVDVAFLDATFYSGNELPHRKVSEIPHPLMEETMQMFDRSPARSKIVFIHFNHSNPVLSDAALRQRVLEKGFRMAAEGDRY